MNQEIERPAYIALKDVVTEFVEGSVSGALLIKGPWGIGKTCAVREALGVKSNGKLRPHFYISLYGVRSQDELYQQIVLGACGKWAGENDTGSRRLVGDILKAAGSFFGDSTLKLPSGTSVKGSIVSSFALATFGKLISGAIVVVDDLERSGGMKMEEILGSISRLVEVRQCKVIAICNPDELGDSAGEFKRQHEKVFEREFLYRPMPDENARFVTHGRFRDVVLHTAKQLDNPNIRVMKRAVELVESANKKSLSASDVSREIFMISLARLAFVYFGYRDKIELDKVVDFSPFKQMGIFSGESDSEITFTEDILQRAQYKPVEGARFAVEIVEKGVTNWNELRELLASSDEEIFKKGKQDEFDALVFGVLGNFSQVPDGFKERVISFIDENIAFLDVYHIELGGYFLKEIWGDSSFEKRWEEMWADANISRISKAKLREIMFHRSDVSEFLKERARAQYGAYVSKPKVSEAFLELFAGGAGEAHLDVLARLSASDCQAWLKEEHGQSLISETANFVASSFRGEGVHQKIASTIAKAVLSIEDDSVEGLFRVTQWKRTARRLSGDVGALESFLAGVINER